tara:strand:+ start:274 stop:1128 length:855 start_codon:yes stop_codon:yes gene_type:complete
VQNKSKISATVTGATILVIAASAYLYSLQRENRRHEQQLADYEQHVQELLAQVETGSRQRVALQNQLDDLLSERNTLNSQLTSVEDQLDEVEQQLNPDYQQIESEIRQQISYELQQQEIERNNIDPRVKLLQELIALDPLELGEIMSVNGQFGRFLQALDVDDQRMEVIVTALTDVVADQNLARQELMQQMREGEVGRREMRSEIREIMSPRAQYETLVQTLTDNELLVFRQALSEQREQTNAIRDFTLNTGDSTSSTIYFEGGGRSPAISLPYQPLTPPKPRN